MSLWISPLPIYCSDEQSLLSSWKEAQSRGIHWSRSNTSCKGLWNLKPGNHTTSRSAPTSLNWTDNSASILFSHHRDSDFRCVELSSKEASPELMQFHHCLLNFQVKKSCHFLPKYKLDSCNWLSLVIPFPARSKKRRRLLRNRQQFSTQTSQSSGPDLPNQLLNSNIHIFSFSVN